MNIEEAIKERDFWKLQREAEKVVINRALDLLESATGCQSLSLEEHVKLLANRQSVLIAYAHEQAKIADANSKEWYKAGDIVNAAYRDGMWYAYNDILGMLPSPNSENKDM